MKPAKLKLTIYQGATFRKRFTYWGPGKENPVDLTGCTARMQVRRQIGDTSVLLELTTENGGIILGGQPAILSYSFPIPSPLVFPGRKGATTWRSSSPTVTLSD